MFKLVITKHFEKHYLKRGLACEKELIDKAKEIHGGIFYKGEGRVKGSKRLFKKRIALAGQSKRKGGRILFVLFQKVDTIYVPYAVWKASSSEKRHWDQILKSRKALERLIQDTISFMGSE